MPQTVLVTGATGFIAKHIVQQLLAAGHTVVGSIRSPERAQELRNAVAPGLSDATALERLSTVPLDLTQDAGWQEAMAGVDAVLHTASPFPLTEPRDEAELITPAVEGTLRAMRAAQGAGIKRVVLTSSVAAIMSTDLPAGRAHYTEDDWTDLDHPAASAYIKSKTLAERAAWDFVREHAPEIALTTINPGFVLGPPLDAQFGTSLGVAERLLRGKDPMLPRVGFPVVDVRDIAAMHLAALTRPESAGRRYIGAAGFLWFSEMAKAAKAAHPERKVTTREAPSFVIRALALFDPAIKSIVPSLGKRQDVSNAAARADLGITFRTPQEAVQSATGWLVANSDV